MNQPSIYRTNPNLVKRQSRTMLYVAVLLCFAPIVLWLQWRWVQGQQSTFSGGLQLKVQTERIPCEYCARLGVLKDPRRPGEVVMCPVCFGVAAHFVRKLDQFDVICPNCSGAGRALNEVSGQVEWCPRCGGRGLIRSGLAPENQAGAAAEAAGTTAPME